MEEEDFKIDLRKKKDRLMLITFASLAFSLVSTITYLIYTIATRGSVMDYTVSIISVIMLVAFSVILVVTGFFIENKKAKISIIVASLILAIYSLFQVITDATQTKDYVLDFTNYDIKEVVSWANERDIELIQEFKYDEEIEEFHIISQDVKKDTPLRKVNKLKVVVSKGINPNKKADVSNMVGWKLDDVISFIDENHLTNVTINFEFNNNIEKDTIISQDIIREIRRNEPVTLVSSLGRKNDLTSVSLENLVGLDLFHALIYVGRNNIRYSIVYEYSSDKEDGTVLKQNLKKWTVIGSDRSQELILTVSQKEDVTVPDLKAMSKNEITNWATQNRIKLIVEEEYDEKILKDRVISYEANKGDMIKTGSQLKVIFSKGTISMIEFKDLDEFRTWADENNVAYTIDYEYSDKVAKGKLISSSHKKGQIIKNTETIKLVISQGGKTTVPNLTDLTKKEAETKCKENNIKCEFTYLNNNIDYTKVTKQSMRSGTEVPVNTTVTVTIGK